ncbi:ankyrin repeat domain-containing protein [Cohnella soli]|uniref:Ankyrin repeat domain-containing protein n=1 Tax=Cohnella soli TaxID=425005 RepID=A0ABW0HSF8_9BACL
MTITAEPAKEGIPLKKLIVLLTTVLMLAGCSMSSGGGVNEEAGKMNLALHSAAERGDAAELKKLIDGGALLDSQDGRGRTAMMVATYANRPEAVRLLIEAGADINLQDDMLNNPFLYAGAEGLEDILDLLIKAKADTKIRNRYGGVAIIPASEKGHVNNVRTLLEKTDINVNHVNDLGWTALLEAIILSDGGERHQQIVRLLLDHGADANIADGEGVTPLQHAKRRGYAEIAKMVADAGGR